MKYLFLLASLLVFSTSQATDYSERRAYEIEVIIFEQLDGKSATSEIWPDLVKTESTQNSIELHFNSSKTELPGPDNMAYYYSQLREENLQLKDQAKRIQESEHYKLLFHKAWIQPGLNEEEAETVHISTEQTDNTLKLPVIDSLQNLTVDGNDQSPLIVNTEKPRPDLDGTAKVILGRYLHINFNLVLKRDLAPKEGIIQPGTELKNIRYYPVQTERRMRSKEVHYIDHPLIGILVLATPFEVTDTETTEEFEPGLQKLNEININ